MVLIKDERTIIQNLWKKYYVQHFFRNLRNPWSTYFKAYMAYINYLKIEKILIPQESTYARVQILYVIFISQEYRYQIKGML